MLYSRGYNWNKLRLSALSALKKLSFDGLLSGAWFHKKALTDEVVDETPDVDTSRTWHKARALQFTGTEYIDVPYQLDLTQKYKFTYEFICTEYNNWEPIIDSRVQPSDRSFSNYIRPDRTVSVNSQYGQLNFDPLITDCRYLVTIEHNGSEITATFENTTLGTSQTLSNSTLAYTPATAETFFRIGGAPYATSGLRQRLGYFKYEEDGITLIEYAFEEGEGTTCYNRVMNNFHGTINNATISTFRVEDVRITNGDQGTFLNTDGYSPLNVYTSDFSSGIGGLLESLVTASSVDGITDGTTSKDDVLQAVLTSGSNNHYVYKNGIFDLSNAYEVSFEYYIPSVRPDGVTPQTIDGLVVRTGVGSDGMYPFSVVDSWESETIQNWSPTSNASLLFMCSVGGFTGSIDADGDVYYLKNIVVTQPNVYVPRPRVTDIPLYNAGKYAYYIPDHANNYIDLNTAFAGLTNDGDWMEFGIATVGTGEPNTSSTYWATYTSGSSQFFANITSGVDFRFFGPNGGQNQMRTVAPSIDVPNNDFYSLKVTKTVEAPAGTSGVVGQLDLFDRSGNLIVSHNLSAGTLGNEGTYTFNRFFASGYGTDFILAYLKLSDGTVWNGANDFNGGVNITNTGTGNVTKIFFESVDEDVLGNPLTYKGQVAQPLSLVNSNGAYLEAPHRVDFSQIDVSDFTMTFYAYLDSSLSGAGTNRELFSNQNTTQGLLYFSDQRLYFYAGGHNGQYNFSSHIPDEEIVNKWQKFSIIRNDSANTISFVVENDSRTVTTDPAQSGAVAPYNTLGRMYSNPGLGGTLAWASLHSKAMTIEEARAIDPYNMDTDSLEIFLVPSAGSGSTVFDVSGNNNHGTIRNATLSNFWIKQDQFHWNLKKGFSLYDDDATGAIIQRVPLGLNPTISGYTKVSDNPAGKWHNDAETEINFPHTAKLHMINEQFDYKPFFYKNAQLEDATAAYSMRKVIADYEGPLLNVVRSSDLQAQDFYPDSRGDLDTTAITNFVNEATPVLDDYTGAAAAYSLRKVRSAYTGDAIRVRRSSDNALQDIGFDANGDLDTTTLTTFVNASGNAYISDFRVIGDPPVDQEDMGETGGTGAGGQSIADVSDAYKFTQDGSTGIHRAGNPTNANIVGGDISISFEYYLPSGQTSNRILFITNDAGDAQVDLTTTDAWTTYSTTFSGIAGDQFWFYSAIIGQGLSFTGNGSDHFYLKNIVVTQTDADGAVTTWYDQTQNDPLNQNNATQSDPDYMPLIVEAGDVVTENGKPSVRFDNSVTYNSLEKQFASALSQPVTIFGVMKNNDGNKDHFYDGYTNRFSFGYDSLNLVMNAGSGLSAGVYATGVKLVSNLFNTTDSKLNINGVTEASGDVGTQSMDGISIGTLRTSLSTSLRDEWSLSGNIQEIIIFDSDQSTNRTGIEANIGRYYSIDGFADGRVATWYDQANANHATQSTPDQQPLIVSDGALVLENSKPAIQFDGVNDLFQTVSDWTTGDSTTFHVVTVNDTTGYQTLLGSYYNDIDPYEKQVVFGGSGWTRSTNPISLGQNLLEYTYFNNGADVSFFNNGSSNGGGEILGTQRIDNIIGSFNNSGVYAFTGKYQELIHYNSDQSSKRQDIEKNIADYYDITLSGNSGVESWVKNVSFVDMYQTWYDYEYLHRLFANFEIPNKVFKVLAYTNELTADQRQQVYDYLQKNYHPIYTPYSTRVLADGGTLAAGQTNTLTIIDSI